LGFVTVTHPHHPLCGQRLALIRVRRGSNPDLIVRLPDDTHAAIAVSATDYADASAPRPPGPAAAALLDLQGLRRAAQFIAQLQEPGHRPPPQP
jgi:hypothetical protein